MNFKKFPKVLLHLHLDGSLNKSLIKKMTSKSIDEINDLCVCNSSDSLTDYLEKFSYPCELLQNKRSLYLFTKRLCKDLKEENVLYAEIRFAPNKHVNKELSYDDVIKSVLKGLKGTNYKLILCMMRNDDDNLNKKIINLCEKYKNSGVVGIDLAGDEIKYPTESFQDLLNMARDKKLNITIHAGEVDNLQSLESAIELNPNRIGHGISIIKDKDLLKKAKDKDILLEICPKSNIDTKIIENYQTHPIKTLKDEIKISINNDNMTTSNINISDEYENLYKNLNFTYEDFKKINIDTIEKTFLSEKDKNKLLKKYLKYYKKYLNFTKNTH